MIIVIPNPSIFEVQEMLDNVAQAYDLDKFFPRPKDCTRAEYLLQGWVFLFYTEDYTPLGYINFTFTNKRGTFPFIGFGSTKYVKWEHLIIARNFLLKICRTEFKQGVRAYIVNERLKSLAQMCGFRRSPRNKRLFFRGRTKGT